MDGQLEDQVPRLLGQFWTLQGEAVSRFLEPFRPASAEQNGEPGDVRQWLSVAARLQQMLLAFNAEQLPQGGAEGRKMFEREHCLELVQRWARRMPLGDPELQRKLWDDGIELWQTILDRFAGEDDSGRQGASPKLPREDSRFADPKWRETPLFALIHQTYLMLAEVIELFAEQAPGLDAFQRQQLQFATRSALDALSPANFPMSNPLVLERTLATKGENLVKGLEHFLADLKKGQLTHTDPAAFEIGRDIAVTPGKVVHETPLYQLIQYTPTTDRVLAVPLVIFPPWFNRFYILDLNPQKSMVRWLVEQGVSVFMVSWKSADATMSTVGWDEYALAQLDAIDHIRRRLAVPDVHAVGYCVAGTTLAATLAMLARRGEAGKVRSATFFTAQVDFELAGDLRLLIDDRQLAMMEDLAADGYLDGRYMAATFNALRPRDLIWRYVIDHYLLGEEYTAFDMLHWNGDTTNLPWAWLKAYLTDLYRDNRLVEPNSLTLDGSPLDLTRVTTPCYVQAGREDHIAPAASVWRVTRHLRGPLRFVLAGSGHIASVVNPPAAGKYRYWVNPQPAATLDEFVAGAEEIPGSWWPDWLAWLKGIDSATARVSGRRTPGRRGDRVVEDAPGRYVRMP